MLRSDKSCNSDSPESGWTLSVCRSVHRRVDVAAQLEKLQDEVLPQGLWRIRMFFGTKAVTILAWVSHCDLRQQFSHRSYKWFISFRFSSVEGSFLVPKCGSSPCRPKSAGNSSINVMTTNVFSSLAYTSAPWRTSKIPLAVCME